MRTGNEVEQCPRGPSSESSYTEGTLRVSSSYACEVSCRAQAEECLTLARFAPNGSLTLWREGTGWVPRSRFSRDSAKTGYRNLHVQFKPGKAAERLGLEVATKAFTLCLGGHCPNHLLSY